MSETKISGSTIIPGMRYRDAPAMIDIRDQDYGGRGFTCRDPEGHLWSVGSYDPWAEWPAPPLSQRDDSYAITNLPGCRE